MIYLGGCYNSNLSCRHISPLGREPPDNISFSVLPYHDQRLHRFLLVVCEAFFIIVSFVFVDLVQCTLHGSTKARYERCFYYKFCFVTWISVLMRMDIVSYVRYGKVNAQRYLKDTCMKLCKSFQQIFHSKIFSKLIAKCLLTIIFNIFKRIIRWHCKIVNILSRQKYYRRILRDIQEMTLYHSVSY